MDNETRRTLNDLIDALEELTRLIEELNPGAQGQLDRIKFFVNRADRAVKDAAGLS
jgi:hypothetical protein